MNNRIYVNFIKNNTYFFRISLNKDLSSSSSFLFLNIYNNNFKQLLKKVIKNTYNSYYSFYCVDISLINRIVFMITFTHLTFIFKLKFKS